MIEIEDVGGSFKKFVRNAPKVLRKHLEKSIGSTGPGLAERMKAMAAVGPDAPHMRDAIEVRQRGAMAEVGIFDPEQAEVALYNEYSPNHQPFMRPAAEQSDKDFVRQATNAVERMEKELES